MCFQDFIIRLLDTNYNWIRDYFSIPIVYLYNLSFYRCSHRKRDLIRPGKVFNHHTTKILLLTFATNPVCLKMFSFVVVMLFVHSKMNGSRCLALTNPIKGRYGAVRSKSIQSELSLGASSSDENQEVVMNKYSR